jgi:hypothetical protein
MAKYVGDQNLERIERVSVTDNDRRDIIKSVNHNNPSQK